MGCRIRVLLADGSEEYRLMIRELLADSGTFEVVGETGQGAEALELARKLRPDLLVFDALLPDMDGFELLQRAADYVGAAVTVTGYCCQHVMEQAIRRHVLLVWKPFTGEKLLEILRDAVEESRAGDDVAPRTGALVTEALRRACLPNHVIGYTFLHSATLLVLREPSLLHHLTKELYPLLAQQYGTRWDCVERDIRTAIEQAWAEGDPERQREFFGSRMCMDSRPTNKQFLTAVVEWVRSRLRKSVA